ncbi:MAG TPA: GNAT family N-acetyltransferase, partial [Candidatus Limnocylindria bacterium]|nr:GNAT family N-acetyltransferase [Candidatus Limnocylindria bacterium]
GRLPGEADPRLHRPMNLGNPDRPVGGLAVPRPAGVEIRPLGRDDFADAIALARELYVLDDNADPEPLRAGYDALVNDVDATPFIAFAEGEAAGLIVQRFRRRLNHATFEGWISDLVVREPFRGRGIGRALLASAIAEWRLRGGHQMMLEVSYDRTVARALYEAAGFENQGKYFEIGPVRTRGIEVGPGVEIRPIIDGDADFEATTRLLAELGRPAPADEKLPALRRTYDQHVRRMDTASMLALLDGTAVGFISLEMRQPFFTTRPQAWIPDLIVSEGARGRNIGAALLDAAFAEAVRRGCYAAALESGHHRAVAHQLYLAAGMSDVGSFYTLTR